MADYYSILKKTIEGLPSNTPQIREAVYAKARTAIEKQLRSIDPAPGEDVIATQLELLETAISSIDNEYGGARADSIEPAVATPDEVPAANEPESAPPPPPPSAPLDTTPSPAEPVAMPTGDVPPPPSVPEPPSVDQMPPPSPEAVPPAMPPEAPVQRQPDPAPAPVAASAPAPTQPIAEPQAPPPGVVPPPQLATPQAPPPAAMPASAPAGNTAPPVGQSRAADAILDKYAKKPKPNLIKRLTVPLIVLILLAAAGFGLWSARDTITPMVASIMGGSETHDGNVQSGNDEPTTVADKEAVKLGADGQDEEAQPIEEESVPEVEAVETAESQEDASSESTPAVEETEANTPETEQAPAATEAANNNNVQLPDGEPAFLYQEADSGSGATRTDASVAWSTTQASPLAGYPEEPVIKAVVSIPEKNLSMEMHLSRNVDETLSASHVIDLKFDVPADFDQGSVDNVLRFVMKKTEEARGEPLVAVPVKVRDNHFLIALDNLEQAVQVNQQLLLNSDWIDINIAYASGKRALVTLSKGADGGVTFQSAFNDWANR